MPAPFRGIAPGGSAGRLPPWLGWSLKEQTAPSQASSRFPPLGAGGAAQPSTQDLDELSLTQERQPAGYGHTGLLSTPTTVGVGVACSVG